jgi:hypothetical protein
VLVLGGGGYALSQLGNDEGGGSGDGGNSQSTDGADGAGDGGDTGDGATQPNADVVYPDADWQSVASDYQNNFGKTIAYQCPADGTIGTVWGADPYTTDSSVCTAAVHAGRISLEDGGWVVIEIRGGQESYEGTTQYGIPTTAYGPYQASFTFVG